MLSQIFVFRLGNLRLGIDLDFVERVEMAAETLTVPAMPGIILGVINYFGNLVPVYNLRGKLSLPPEDINPQMLFLILRTSSRKMIIVVDAVEGVRDAGSDLLTPGSELENKFGDVVFAKMPDGIIMIYNPELFLSSDEEILVDRLISSSHLSETD